MQRSHWLLVEDNSAEAELAREALARTSAVELTIVRSGAEALSCLRREGAYENALPVGLVLLDVNLPGLSGRDVLAEMRADPSMRRVPVVVMSSSDEQKDIVDLYACGANCYLVKPLHHAAFETMIQSLTQFWLSVAQLPATL